MRKGEKVEKPILIIARFSRFHNPGLKGRREIGGGGGDREGDFLGKIENFSLDVLKLCSICGIIYYELL